MHDLSQPALEVTAVLHLVSVLRLCWAVVLARPLMPASFDRHCLVLCLLSMYASSDDPASWIMQSLHMITVFDLCRTESIMPDGRISYGKSGATMMRLDRCSRSWSTTTVDLPMVFAHCGSSFPSMMAARVF